MTLRNCEAPVGPLRHLVTRTPGEAPGTVSNSVGVVIIFDQPVYNLQPVIEALRAVPGLHFSEDPRIKSPRPWDRRGVAGVFTQDVPQDDIDSYEQSLPDYFPRAEQFVYPDGEQHDRATYRV